MRVSVCRAMTAADKCCQRKHSGGKKQQYKNLPCLCRMWLQGCEEATLKHHQGQQSSSPHSSYSHSCHVENVTGALHRWRTHVHATNPSPRRFLCTGSHNNEWLSHKCEQPHTKKNGICQLKGNLIFCIHSSLDPTFLAAIKKKIQIWISAPCRSPALAQPPPNQTTLLLFPLFSTNSFFFVFFHNYCLHELKQKKMQPNIKISEQRWGFHKSWQIMISK